jgi:hypothetical protein
MYVALYCTDLVVLQAHALVLPLLVPRVGLANNVKISIVSLPTLPPHNLFQAPNPSASIPSLDSRKKKTRRPGSSAKAETAAKTNTHLAMLAPLLHGTVHLHPPNLREDPPRDEAVAPGGDGSGRPGGEGEGGPGHRPRRGEGEGAEGAQQRGAHCEVGSEPAGRLGVGEEGLGGWARVERWLLVVAFGLLGELKLGMS